MDVSKKFEYKTVVGSLVLGQFLSLLIISTSFTSSELARKGINAPTSQSFLNYVLLALVFGIAILYRRKALKAKWYYYILLSLVDVEANYLVVKSFQYTSLTSVMLLDCWTIPCVLILTRIFLKTKYGFKKIIAVIICIAASIMLVFSDVFNGDRSAGSAPVKGDLFAIAGATLYAVSNVSEEYLVKNASRSELMAMLGIFGAIISAIQISILERTELRAIHWTAGGALPFVGFSVAMFLFYSLVPVLLKVDWLYFVSFAVVTIGLMIYAWGDKDTRSRQLAHDEEANVEAPREEEASVARTRIEDR